MILQVAILCGGLGNRLGELTARTPKPSLRVDGVPFLNVLLFELGRHGVRRVRLLAGFAAHRIIDYALSTPMKVRFGLEIEVVRRAATRRHWRSCLVCARPAGGLLLSAQCRFMVRHQPARTLAPRHRRGICDRCYCHPTFAGRLPLWGGRARSRPDHPISCAGLNVP
jgi:hypothetical protein